MVLITFTVAELVPARPFTILKLVPGVSTPVTVGITVIPVALIFDAPDGKILPNKALLASVVEIVPPTFVVNAPVMVNVFVPRLNPCACTAPVTAALPPTTLICFSPLAPPIAPVTLLPLFSVSVPVFAVLVVIAPVSVNPAPRLIKPSPAKTGAEVTLPLKLIVPVPLTLVVVAKTFPLKFTVVPTAPALTLRKRIKFVPVNPVTVELPRNRTLPVLLASLVNAPPRSLLVLIFWLLPTVKVPAPAVSTPFSTPSAFTTPGRATAWRAELMGAQAAKAAATATEINVIFMQIP